MASIVAGVQYGLSSHANFNENKSLIFVKLTDSAQRAIEDFVRNRNKLKQNPTIQFDGSEGRLSFPSSQSSHGTANFTFSLSGNQDIEGPQGGFECIQQTGPGLESLGTIPSKMRIHANDDVYETTRHRMAVAEENNKNKCTRMIKANGPNIGRKVKVQGTGRTIPPPPLPSNVRQRESPSISTSGAGSSRLSSASASSKPVSRIPPPVRSKPEKQLPDITRTPIRERLIHLLALRPYKKPEIYERINREGCKEKDRSKLFEHLTEIAFNRDNAYHLKRAVWNDVRDNWIHYTEEEKSLLKRRKPQNLTPPGSSDGSSGSGQSPNSVHPGSPPAITAPPLALLKSKRPGYYEGNDGLPTKKPRISHYRKPEPLFVNHGENRRTAGGSVNSGDSRVCSGDSRVNSGDSRISSAESRVSSAERVSGSVNSIEVISGSNSGTCNSGSSLFAGQNSNWNQRQQGRLNSAERTTNNEVLRGSSYPAANLCLSASDSEDEQSHVAQQHELGTDERRNHGNSTNARLENSGPAGIAFDPTTSPNSSSNVTNNASTQTAQAANHHEAYPDYLTCYTKVSSLEQKRRYKEEFNSLYPEYKQLFDLVTPVQVRYVEWKRKYDEIKAQGNHQQLDRIKNQIVQDYKTMNHDLVYKQRCARKDYLGGKLNYLKTLVEEYDIHCIVNNSIPQGKENQLY
ncbi:RNA polymerase II elongation factor Ell-like isoform X2 [Belonocnema kinseyi]|uniref:RNA polymerase II elongation factor Ell-like isoform X2 n=1 Tax=Belonocnema kinseyi TaxID=2817044 RepID=UPI00143D5083|nr:RNA polymerase II elongation factor Ell-like isoform X2 [Belonocnema kinseyi]